MKKGSGTGKLDDFAQIMSGQLTESAATTLTFSSRLDLGYSLADNVGLVIHRVEWSPSLSTRNLLLDESDSLAMALVTSDQISTLAVTGSNIISYELIGKGKFGVAASGYELRHSPAVTTSFVDLPGGGVLVAPNPLYIAILGGSIASAAVVAWRFYYTTVTLNDRGFRELWETWNALRV